MKWLSAFWFLLVLCFVFWVLFFRNNFTKLSYEDQFYVQDKVQTILMWVGVMVLIGIYRQLASKSS